MANTIIQKIIEKTVEERQPLRRIDYRSEKIFTIDGPGCRSHDDAIGIIVTKNGWRLSVHIADVADVVSFASELDKRAVKKALKRGSFPMFCKTLAKNDFSLLPGETRNTMSFIFHIDHSGRIRKAVIGKGLIRSVVNGEYEEVNAILNASEERPVSEELRQKYETVTEDLQEMKKLYVALNSRRTGKDITKYGNKISSYGIVSEFMVQTNMLVGEYLFNNGLPSFFRVASEATKNSTEIAPGMNIEAYSQVTSPIRDLESLKSQQILTMYLEGFSANEIHNMLDEQLAMIRRKTFDKHITNAIAA